MSEPGAADPREPLGRLVHDTRVAWEAKQAAAEGRHRFNLGTWEGRGGDQRELDMAIGEAAAAAEFERIRHLAERSQAVGTAPDGTTKYFTRIMAEDAHDGR